MHPKKSQRIKLLGMDHSLHIFNTLSRIKERFIPMNPPHVGLYVCGPTVYGDAHLGHARPAMTFDILFRYLSFLGYKVRYVRNITDVGHLENDADEGEDKIARKARLEQLEPMEIVQYYTTRYHKNMEQLNVLAPSIEPRASGHIIEQISLIEDILKADLAYVVNGSVYFDVEKYNQSYDYGKLSGRKLEDLISNTRELEGQGEKRSPVDFALWKKAQPEHIMRWPSPWSEGFPGWHLECSAMSTRYLGQPFDIHGGGMDLLFPHHEAEIAQSCAATGQDPVRYWMHNNMITINGQKMGKSLGNFITLNEFFSGQHQALEKAYHPMTIRFFILQAHYRSTLDFSNAALQAAEKGLERLQAAFKSLPKIQAGEHSSLDIPAIALQCKDAMDDDLNTPIVISLLFDLVKIINLSLDGKESLSQDDINLIDKLYQDYAITILGLEEIQKETQANHLVNNLMHLLIDLRKGAKERKDFQAADLIRDQLKAMGVIIKDTREGSEWSLE